MAGKRLPRSENGENVTLKLKHDSISSTHELIMLKMKGLKNWILRGIFSILLISYFCLTIYLGPIVIMVTTVLIQVKCFAEIIEIGYKIYHPVNEPPLFQFVSWYFLFAVNYFCYGETLVEYFSVFTNQINILQLLVNYHRFFSFCLYSIGIMWFVSTLRRKYDKHQFSLLACTHVALLFIVAQSYMIGQNIFQGLIWLTVPVTAVVCNDIMAYLFGKLFGKTPLISVSPKKTWEGFMGAVVFTIAYSCIISHILCHFPYFTCPLQYVENSGQIKLNTVCDLDSTLFKLQNFTVNINIPGVMEENYVCFEMFPFVFHAFVLSLFVSIIAPFGGFFASGFKRAFEVKDFGGTIPGHGGVLDRFDCQFLMATFVNVYIHSFIKVFTSSPEKIFKNVLYLEPKQQVQFFLMLKDSLGIKNMGLE